jgi:anti-sigma factor RsiW
MNGMDHARFEELKDAYVLGALPDEERRQFEEYLAQHPERQAEIGDLGAVASLLALSPQENTSRPRSLGKGSWAW